MLLTLLGPQPSGAIATKLDTETEQPANNGLTFSNGDLTATRAVSGGQSRAWTLDKVDKNYLEATLDATAGGWQGAIGLILSNKAFTSWGGDTDSFGVMADGAMWLEGVSQGDLGGDIGVGGVLCMAVDRPNNLLWVRHNNGNWNGSGTANPATGTGGISISGLPAGNLFIGVYLDAPIGAAMTIRPTAAEWTIGAPAGFTAIAGTTYPAFPTAGAVAYDEVPYSDTWTTGGMAWLAGQNDPYGGSRAVRYYSTSGTTGQMGNHSIIWNVSHTYTTGEPYTAEIEAKADGAQYIRVCHYDGVNDWGVIFDLVNGTVGSLRAGGGTETNASITSLGSGWYRCRFDFLGDTTWQNYQLAPTNTNSTDFDASTTLAPGDGILLFRFQTYPAVATISATLSATEAGDTAAFSASAGSVLNASLAATEAGDTAAFAASISTGATLGVTEAGDTAAFTFRHNISLAATEAGDTAAFSASAGSVLNASLAATEAGDTAAFAASASTNATLGVTEAGDTAAVSTTIGTNALLAATEAGDTAAFVFRHDITLGATEAGDTAALSITARTNATLGVTESGDTAAFVVDIVQNYGFDAGGFFDGGFNTPPGARLTATEAGDTAAFTFSLNGSMAATEAGDTAALVVGNDTRLLATEAGDTAALATTSSGNALLAVEGSDTAAFSASARTNAALASSEAGDTAAILANNALAIAYAVTEAGDTAAFAVTVRTNVSFAVSEAQDQAALVVLPQVLGTLASTEAQDLASIGYSVYTSISYDDAEVLYADPEQQPFPVEAEGGYLVVPVEVRVMMSDGYPAPFDSEPRRRPQ
jgi:hypothetical protein